jgi:GTP-binding nuclear protein Ran
MLTLCFIFILRHICFFFHASITTSDPQLQFVEPPALEPPEVYMDPMHAARMEAELVHAQNTSLPEEAGEQDDDI